MKQLLRIIALIVFLSGTCWAEDYFATRTLSDLRVTQADPQNNTADIRDTAGDSATVQIGDALGRSGAKIIQISDLFVVVQTDQGTTRMPVPRITPIGENRIGLH